MSDVLWQQTGQVARITLNRPEVRNAFDDGLIAALTEAFERAAAAPDVRCVVLEANGPAFCAGGDLNWMRRMAGFSYEENRRDAGGVARMLSRIHACPKPTIACVQGDAYAGGVGLLAACDVAMGVETAGFCLSEVRIGLIPATIGPYVMRAMGLRAARRYFLSGERFDAAEALRTGLLHAVHPDAAALHNALSALCEHFCQVGPKAAAASKRLLDRLDSQAMDDALIESTVDAIASVRASDEGVEGVRAFLEKRPPSWRQAA